MQLEVSESFRATGQTTFYDAVFPVMQMSENSRASFYGSLIAWSDS